MSDDVSRTLKNAYMEAAALEAAETVLNEGNYNGQSLSVALLSTQKKILKEKYNIEWIIPFKLD